MADAAARIVKRTAFHRNELPSVFSGGQRELEHPVGLPIPHFAVRSRKAQQVVASPARTHHDFADSVSRVRIPLGILRSKPLVGMLVAGEDQVGVRCVKVLPEGPQLRVQRMTLEKAAAEKRMMPIGENAGVGMPCEVLSQPGLLG